MHLICSGRFAMSMRFLRACSRKRRRENPRPVPPTKNKRPAHSSFSTPIAWQTPRRLLLHALDVAGFGGIHFDSVAFIYERWNLHDETSLERGRLAYRAGRGFLQGGLGADYAELHRVRKVHADGFFLEKFHFYDGVGNQVVDRIAEEFAGEVHLLVRFRIHEMEIVAFVVEVLEFDFVKNCAIHEFFGAKAIVNHRAALEVFHARLHRSPLVAGSAVIDAKNREKLALVLDDHAGAKLCGFDAAHSFHGRGSGQGLLKIAISEIPASGPQNCLWLRAE